MPITVSQIAAQFQVTANGPVKWGANCPSRSNGVYIVCTPKTPWQLDANVITYWCNNTNIKTFRDGSALTPSALQAELQKYLIPGEEIVYIGKATSLRKRLYAYYGTPLGKRRPHAGGYWIQALLNINSLDVYWINSNSPKKLEQDMLDYFSKNVSCNFGLCIPFANLEITKSQRKVHIIRRPKI